MTEDIVKRLRKVEPDLPGDRTRWYRNPDGPEAADEIERLRAANLILRDKYLRLQHKLGRIGQVLEEPCAAKAALGESDD